MKKLEKYEAEVKQAREVVPKLSRFIGEEIPWIVPDSQWLHDRFIGEAVVWNYDGSGEWVLVNYDETRWVTMGYIKSLMRDVLKEEEE